MIWSLAVLHADADKRLAWSPDGKSLITGNSAGISVIEAINWPALMTIR